MTPYSDGIDGRYGFQSEFRCAELCGIARNKWAPTCVGNLTSKY